MTIMFDVRATWAKDARFKTTDPRGHYLATVHAVEAALVGAWIDGKPYTPDTEAVLAAMPNNWRKAFGRGNGVWFVRDSNLACCTLRNVKGERIAEVRFTVREA